jgi:hypothetical protein
LLKRSPSETTKHGYRVVQIGFGWTHGDSKMAKIWQFSVETVKGALTPVGTPTYYDTPSGELGAQIGTAIGKFLPF